VVDTELHKRRDMLLALDVGWYSVRTGRKEGVEWRCCRVRLIDIPVKCGAQRSWSAVGRRTVAATRDGVLAVGVCVGVCVRAG
jgi:hypothetical protein